MLSSVNSFQRKLIHLRPVLFCCRRKLTATPKIDEIVSLCKRRGFVFPSNEIYSPLPGFFDYGPLGIELKNNIKNRWWRDMVQRREDIVGIDCSIVSRSQIWEASGHVDGFSDPLVDCKVSKHRYRADQLFYGALTKPDGSIVCYVSIIESSSMLEDATTMAHKKAKTLGEVGPYLPLILKEITHANDSELAKIPSPATGCAGDLTKPRNFNLMFQTNVGAVSDGSTGVYLRPETAQGIFANFANIQRTARMKIPFGIAQIGKAFRNEITPRNFIFRSREFEQMEIEYFIKDDNNSWEKHFREWIEIYLTWLGNIGIPNEMLSLKEHPPDKLAHYAKACTDIVFNYPFGTSELMGVAARGNFDLTQHSRHSGKSLDYLDPSTNEKYIPQVIEPSIGLDRLVLALLCSAYFVEPVVNGELRTILRLDPSIAPVKAAVLPLVSNNVDVVQKARQVFNMLRMDFACDWDQSGAVGRRYRRADECGTVCCVTVDFESLTDNCVTVRDRDTMVQRRISIGDLNSYIRDVINVR